MTNPAAAYLWKTHRASAGVRAVARCTAVAALLLALPATALAHAHLTGTSPAANARLTTAPRDIVLTFSEAPTLAMSALRLVGPDSQAVALSDLGHTGGVRTLSAAITGSLRAGRYTVEWQTAGDDGHVQHGSFHFVIAEGASGLTALPTADSGSRNGSSVSRDSAHLPDVSVLDSAVGAHRDVVGLDVSSPLYVVIRWVQFASLLLVIGAVAFRWWILPRAGVALDEVARRTLSASAAISGLRGTWVLLLSAFARLAAQRATMHAVPGASSAPGVGPMLLHTAWGHGWILELAALVILVLVLLRARTDTVAVMPWRIAAAAVVALAFVPSLSGHAVADRTFAPFTILFDGAHVLAAGTWLGTLAVMLAALPVASRAASGGLRDALARAVDAFSPVALTCAAILVFTGVVAARVHVASWGAFTETSYGRALLIKLAVVVALIVVAAFNFRRVKPTLHTEGAAGAERLARSGRLELGVAIVVLLVTAVLVALPTPSELVR